MKKLIYLDIGTHFGQEFQSMFGTWRYFYYKMFRRFIAFYFFNVGESISVNYMFKLVRGRKELQKARKDFLVFFVEANPKIVNFSDVYQEAQGVFNCALTGNDRPNIAK